MKNKNYLDKISYTSISVSTLLSWFALKKIKLSPAPQRYSHWPFEYVNDLIDTMKSGLPIPSVTLLKDSKNNYHVVDGRQRLTSMLTVLLGKDMEHHIKSDDDISKSTWKDNYKKLQDDKLLFSDLDSEIQEKIISYRIPIVIFDASKFNNDQYAIYSSLLFDRLNRNTSEMTNEMIYLSGLQMSLPTEMPRISKIKTDKLIKVNDLLNNSSRKKTIKYGIVTDIRAMRFLVDEYELDNPKHKSVRYNAELKNIENKYISNYNQSKKSEEEAGKELNTLENSVDTIIDFFIKYKANMANIKIKNQITRLAIMWLAMKKDESLINKNYDLIQKMKEVLESDDYKEFNKKSGISSPERLYKFLNLYKERIRDTNK